MHLNDKHHQSGVALLSVKHRRELKVVFLRIFWCFLLFWFCKQELWREFLYLCIIFGSKLKARRSLRKAACVTSGKHRCVPCIVVSPRIFWFQLLLSVCSLWFYGLFSYIVNSIISYCSCAFFHWCSEFKWEPWGTITYSLCCYSVCIILTAMIIWWQKTKQNKDSINDIVNSLMFGKCCIHWPWWSLKASCDNCCHQQTATWNPVRLLKTLNWNCSIDTSFCFCFHLLDEN